MPEPSIPTREQIEELKRLREAARTGEWWVDLNMEKISISDTGYSIFSKGDPCWVAIVPSEGKDGQNAEFLAMLVNLADGLLRAAEERDAAENASAALQEQVGEFCEYYDADDLPHVKKVIQGIQHQLDRLISTSMDQDATIEQLRAERDALKRSLDLVQELNTVPAGNPVETPKAGAETSHWGEWEPGHQRLLAEKAALQSQLDEAREALCQLRTYAEDLLSREGPLGVERGFMDCYERAAAILEKP